MFKINDLIIICIIIYGLIHIKFNNIISISNTKVNELVSFKNNNNENLIAEVHNFEYDQPLSNYDIVNIVDQKKDILQNEERVEKPYDTYELIDIPRPETIPDQPITSSTLEQFEGKTIREIYNSLTPDYSEYLELLDNTNISGNISMSAENNKVNQFDTTYNDSIMDFDYLIENFTKF